MIHKRPFLCLFVLLFSAFSAFAENGPRFDLGLDSFLFISQFIEGHPDRDGGGDSNEGNDIIEDATVFDFIYLSPVWPLISADLYYQTSGENLRFGFGGKIHSLIFMSIIIPSVYAEMNLERFSATAQFGLMPIVFNGVIPLMPLPLSDISISAWFKITERFRIGFSSMMFMPTPAYSFTVSVPVCAISFRWTSFGADA